MRISRLTSQFYYSYATSRRRSSLISLSRRRVLELPRAAKRQPFDYVQVAVRIHGQGMWRRELVRMFGDFLGLDPFAVPHARHWLVIRIINAHASTQLRNIQVPV